MLPLVALDELGRLGNRLGALISILLEIAFGVPLRWRNLQNGDYEILRKRVNSKSKQSLGG